MPEGDTVYLTAKNLNEALAGQLLERCDIRVPKFATVDLSGSVIDSVVPRGKHLLTRVGDFSIHTHLKMEGSWHLYRHGSKWQRPAWQARIILGTAEHLAVGFELGLVEVIPRASEGEVLGYLGPDLLSDEWNPDDALERLLARPERSIFMGLLDQRNLAGIGNVYANELCFLRGVLPTRPIGEVSHPAKMIDLAHRLIVANKDRTGRTTTGRLRGETSWVYGRAGRPCLRCGTTIEASKVGDTGEHARDAYWCPQCQH